ncbi:hypothetical protein MMC07_002838 [Pseudocyphellaria aurata]|nr:hypothetical protein [Pseudocyphellaria aurata]
MPPNSKRQLGVEKECSADTAPSRANKRRKLENEQPHRTPSSFWDNLSRQWLTARTLREFDRRTVPSIAPEPPDSTHKKDVDLARLKRFASHGGPSLSDLRTYPESGPADPSIRSLASTSSTETQGKTVRIGGESSVSSKSTKCSAYDFAFQQHLIDNGVFSYLYAGINIEQEPHNLEDIRARLTPRRASLSPESFTPEAFWEFRRKNLRAETESIAMSIVFPSITGTTNIRSRKNLLFGNLEDLTDGSITKAKPDCYDGSLPANLDSQIRKELGPYILPSTNTTAPCLPNFFIEGTRPDKYFDKCKRQALYNGALGARGIARLRSYVNPDTADDNKAYVFSSIYDPGFGVLSLYTHHCTRSTNPNHDHEYHMTPIGQHFMTNTLDAFREGASALRYARDLAREFREGLIMAANSKMLNAERSKQVSSKPIFDSRLSDKTAHWETETLSTDELAVDTSTYAIPNGRTSVRA